MTALIASTTTVGLGTLPIFIRLTVLVENVSNALLGDGQGIQELKRLLDALRLVVYLVPVVELGRFISLWIQLLNKVCGGSCIRYSNLSISSCLPRRRVNVQPKFKSSFEVRQAFECLHSALTE